MRLVVMNCGTHRHTLQPTRSVLRTCGKAINCLLCVKLATGSPLAVATKQRRIIQARVKTVNSCCAMKLAWGAANCRLQFAAPERPDPFADRTKAYGSPR